MGNLLLAHLVGHDKDAAIAPKSRQQRERSARVSACRFDNRTAWPEPLFFRAPEHVGRESILVAAARVEKLAFDVDLDIEPGGHATKADDGRVANGFADVVESALHHARTIHPAPGLSFGAAPGLSRGSRPRFVAWVPNPRGWGPPWATISAVAPQSRQASGRFPFHRAGRSEIARAHASCSRARRRSAHARVRGAEAERA